MRYCLAALLCATATATSVASQTLVINELLASNDSGLTDAEGDHDDWLELYNPGPAAVDIAGMYVTDDEQELTAWQIPTDQPAATVVPAGGYLLLWFDGEPEQGPVHVDARLSRGGELVALTDRDGSTVVDSVRFGAQRTDVSYGRLADGGPDWGFFALPTPAAPNSESGQVRPPLLSLAPGLYSGPQALALQAPAAGAVVYYTLDGSDPTAADSLRYAGPVALTDITTLRAIAQVPGHLPSPVVTGTYLIAADYSLPVVSLVTDPANLYDEETGLFVLGPGVGAQDEWPFWNSNWFTQDEKPAHIEYFDAAQPAGFSMDVGIELAGGWSRALPKKSFDVKMRSVYGAPRLDYPLFPENAYDTYDGLVLRAGAEDHSRTMNEIVYKAKQEFGLHVDMQAYRPVVLLLNGQYWGIYSLMERKDADFVANRHEVEEIDLMADGDRVIEGSAAAYEDLVDFLNSNVITQDAVYAAVRERISVKSFIDMWLLHVYTNHGDENNIRYWRPRTPDGQWRWIAYDFDWWLEPEAGRLADFAAIPEAEGYDLLGRMLANEAFRAQFVNRLADFLNTTGAAASMERLIDASVAEVAQEIDADLERWREWRDVSGPYTLDRSEYEWKVGWVRQFVQRRPALLRQQLVEVLGLSGTAVVTLNREGPGEVEINSLEPQEYPWSGTYFRDVPLRIRAAPQPGYQFVGWTTGSEPAERTEELTGDAAFTAHFAPVVGAVVINEISYHPAAEADAGDWVELRNASAQPLDLSGWRLIAGGGDGFALPQGTTLQPDQYLVLVRDAALFQAVFPGVTAFFGDLGFGLSNGGETITVIDAAGRLIDQLAYDDQPPWPTAADGEGATLELIDPGADNALAASWRASADHGTPGRPNDDLLTAVTQTVGTSLPTAFELQGNYPNPFNSQTVIRYGLPAEALTVLRLYNTAGQQVGEPVRARQQAGYYAVRVDGSDLASGVYLVRLEAGPWLASGVMTLLK